MILSKSVFAQGSNYNDYSRFRIFGAYTSEIENDNSIFNIYFNYRWSDFIEIYKSKDQNVFLSLEAGTKFWVIFLPNINLGPEFTFKRMYCRLTTGIGYGYTFLGGSPHTIFPMNGIDIGYRTASKNGQGVEFELSFLQHEKSNDKNLITIGVGLPIF